MCPMLFCPLGMPPPQHHNPLPPGNSTPTPWQKAGPSVPVLALLKSGALRDCELLEDRCQAWPFSTSPVSLADSPGEENQGIWPSSPCLSKASSPSSHLQGLLEDFLEEEEGEAGKEWQARWRRQMLCQQRGKEELSGSSLLGLAEVSPRQGEDM